MRISPFIRLAVLVGSLTLTPSFQALATTTDQPVSSPGSAPALGALPSQLTWVDDIINALGQYFKANYPTADFVPYLKQLTVVRDALSRKDRRTVKVEMGAFFKLLTNRSYGISEDAADELANFARVAMPVQEYGIFFPRSVQGPMGQSLEGPTRTGQWRDATLSDAPLSLYP
jgi:hypothetical protein